MRLGKVSGQYHCPETDIELSYLLAGEGVGAGIIGKDIDGAVTDEFLRGVGRVGINRRSRRRHVGLILNLAQNYTFFRFEQI